MKFRGIVRISLQAPTDPESLPFLRREALRRDESGDGNSPTHP